MLLTILATRSNSSSSLPTKQRLMSSATFIIQNRIFKSPLLSSSSLNKHNKRNLLQTFQTTRSIFSQRKLLKLEAEADNDKASPEKQAILYKELLKSGNYPNLIYRYENQPQLQSIDNSQQRDMIANSIKQHPECLTLYIHALSREGEIDRIAQKMNDLTIQNNNTQNTTMNHQSQPPTSPTFNSNSIDSGSAVEYSMDTDLNQWNRSLGQSKFPGRLKSKLRQQQELSRSQQNPHQDFTNNQPIQVVLSESWSWSKTLRQFGSKLFLGVLIITGVSVILDQQGVMKSGIGGAEVEPQNFSHPVTFKDVQGVDEAKHDLEEIVEFLKEPKKFMEVGGKLPKGILLFGPPGTGKTHLARAVAGEANVPFFQMSGSEFDEMYVGVGARRVRELFAAARKKAPCIVFIDEIDAVGSKRSSKDQSYMRQTLNQLLVELDGFSSSEGVVFIGATNTVESLDKALVRPGRLDRHVAVPLPDVRGRSRILEVHSKGVSMSKDIDLSIIARGTPGFSGADLANLLNQAAIKASKDGAKVVRLNDMEWAKDKIMMGAERKSAVISEENKRMTAYHEGGHTLVSLFTEGAIPFHKVTVMPRGSALGVTFQLPEVDQLNYSRKALRAKLDVCLGGRVAEELIYGDDEVTTGASSDLQKASSIARQMVLKFGMSDKVGLASHSSRDADMLSEETKQLIENEVKTMLSGADERARALLKKHRKELDLLADALMEYETLNADEVRAVIKGEKIDSLKTL